MLNALWRDVEVQVNLGALFPDPAGRVGEPRGDAGAAENVSKVAGHANVANQNNTFTRLLQELGQGAKCFEPFAGPELVFKRGCPWIDGPASAD